MSDRPLHEVVSECAPTIEVRDPDYAAKRSDKWAQVSIGPQLAAYIKAADEAVAAARAVLGWIEGHAHVEEDEIELTCNSYDTAAADLRRALEGK